MTLIPTSTLTIFKDIYQKHQQTIQNESLKALAEECWQKFIAIGLPETKWEDWSYADLTPMFENFYNAPTLILKKTNSIPKFISTSKNDAYIQNGKLKHARVNHEVKICAISELNNLELNILVKKIRTKISSEKNPFVLFNYSLLANGLMIKIANQSNVELYINSENDSSVFVSPFLMIECGENTKAEIIYQESRDYKAIAGINSLLLLEAGENSNINIDQLQLDGGNGFHLSQIRFDLRRSATISVQGVFAGSELSRLDAGVDLQEEGVEFNYRILNVLKGICQQHHFARVNHLKPYGTSLQLYKNILFDKSKVSVDGTVEVSKGAKQTNSKQLINNLFLSDQARAFTKPNLKILNDDVKCKHGATSGSLEKDSLFYLKSRGLSEDAARNLIMKSIADEIICYIKNQNLKEFILVNIFNNVLEHSK